jgi:hypothetical protein
MKPGDAFNIFLAQVELRNDLPFAITTHPERLLSIAEQGKVWEDALGEILNLVGYDSVARMKFACSGSRHLALLAIPRLPHELFRSTAVLQGLRRLWRGWNACLLDVSGRVS